MRGVALIFEPVFSPVPALLLGGEEGVRGIQRILYEVVLGG
jgi:hypothetical protein